MICAPTSMCLPLFLHLRVYCQIPDMCLYHFCRANSSAEWPRIENIHKRLHSQPGMPRGEGNVNIWTPSSWAIPPPHKNPGLSDIRPQQHDCMEYSSWCGKCQWGQVGHGGEGGPGYDQHDPAKCWHLSR